MIFGEMPLFAEWKRAKKALSIAVKDYNSVMRQ
jgi:hypothetical protein